MLTLSEAIRLGAMLHPQGFEHYRAYDQHAQIVTCAIGAAEDAGWAEGEAGICAVVPKGCCPVGVCGYQSDGAGLIIHLNDTHRWTREQIADWVATQERASARQPALTDRTDAGRGTTDCAQPVLAPRAL